MSSVSHVKSSSKIVHDEREYTIVYFTAKWCGPCQKIKPIFEELAKKYKDTILFLKIDVDNANINSVSDISSIPVFKFFKRTNKIDNEIKKLRIIGPDKHKLEQNITELIKYD